MTADGLPETRLETVSRQDNPDVPDNPHYPYAVDLPLDTGEAVEVEYYDEEGREREATGTVVQSHYGHVEPAADDPATSDARYNIVMFPSGDRDSPVLALRDDGDDSDTNYIGWITSVTTETGGALYDEDENIYPLYDRDLLAQVDSVAAGDRVEFVVEADDECLQATGEVVERNRGQPLRAAVIDAGDQQYELEYSHISSTVSVTTRDEDDAREGVGTLAEITST